MYDQVDDSICNTANLFVVYKQIKRLENKSLCQESTLKPKARDSPWTIPAD